MRFYPPMAPGDWGGDAAPHQVVYRGTSYGGFA